MRTPENPTGRKQKKTPREGEKKVTVEYSTFSPRSRKKLEHGGNDKKGGGRKKWAKTNGNAGTNRSRQKRPKGSRKEKEARAGTMLHLRTGKKNERRGTRETRLTKRQLNQVGKKNQPDEGREPEAR